MARWHDDEAKKSRQRHAYSIRGVGGKGIGEDAARRSGKKWMGGRRCAEL